MLKKIKKIKNLFHKDINHKNNYLLFIMVISISMLVLYSSYALFMVTKTKTGVYNIMAGDIQINLISTELDTNHHITVAANSTKEFDVTLTNQSTIAAKVILYYKMINPLAPPGDTTIGYKDGTTMPPTGTGLILNENGTEESSITYTLIVKNDSNDAVTVEINAKVGLSIPTLTLLADEFLFSQAITLEGSTLVEGSSSDWLVSTSTNSTGGYTLLSFIGDIDNSSNINVDNDYYNDANTSLFYLDFLGITSAEEMSNSNAYTINIPNTVADKTITELGPSLFSVFGDEDEINESYLRIRSVNIPAGIKKISEVQKEQDFDQMRGSFIFNIHLSTVSLPSSLIEIGNFAFLYNDLNNITIPKTVTAIGHLAFGQISNIESITFEGASDGTSQLEYIGQVVFAPITEIPNLTPLNITIPASVETIGDAAFAYDNITNLTFMGASDGTSHLKYIGAGAFRFNNITELVIPASVENIMINAFMDNPLTSLIFAGTSTDGSGNDTSSLTTIDNHGVFDLYNVNNIVYLPSSLTNIGPYALGCDYRDSMCTFYINRLSIPETFATTWAGNYARKYILDGQGGYTCVENCP